MNKYLGLSIYFCLLSGKTYSAKFLAQKFEVSTKTIYRHINQLICCGLPIMVTSGRLGGFCLMHSNIQAQYLSAEEVLLIKNSISDNTSVTAQILLAKLSNCNK